LNQHIVNPIFKVESDNNGLLRNYDFVNKFFFALIVTNSLAIFAQNTYPELKTITKEKVESKINNLPQTSCQKWNTDVFSYVLSASLFTREDIMRYENISLTW
jgi:hypothetical protein